LTCHILPQPQAITGYRHGVLVIDWLVIDWSVIDRTAGPP